MIALGTGDFQLIATINAEVRPFTIFDTAIRAFH